MKKFTWILLLFCVFSINLNAMQEFYCGGGGTVAVGETFQLHTDCSQGTGGAWVYDWNGVGTVGAFGCDQNGPQSGTDPIISFGSAGVYICAYRAFPMFPSCGAPCCQITITVGSSSPPDCATGTTPSDGASFVSINQDLSWNSVSGATSYDVYFGEAGSMVLVTNTAGTTYDPGVMNNNTDYEWKIVPKNGGGDASGCSTWTFTTELSCSSNPTPASGTSSVSIDQDLSWNAVTGATSYDVYFGETGSMVFVTNTSGTTYDPGVLSYATGYEWQIRPVNANGTVSGCDTWTFTTGNDPTPQVCGVAINDNGANPNVYAILDADISTNNKGILIPRLTTAQRTGLGGMGATEEGLTVYDTDTDCYWLWNGTSWKQFAMEAAKGNKKILELEKKILELEKRIEKK